MESYIIWTYSVCIRGAILCTCLQIASFPGSPQKRFYFSLERGESLGTRLMYRCQWEYVPQPNVTLNQVSVFYSKAPLLIDDLFTNLQNLHHNWLTWPLTFDLWYSPDDDEEVMREWASFSTDDRGSPRARLNCSWLQWVTFLLFLHPSCSSFLFSLFSLFLFWHAILQLARDKRCF